MCAVTSIPNKCADVLAAGPYDFVPRLQPLGRWARIFKETNVKGLHSNTHCLPPWRLKRYSRVLERELRTESSGLKMSELFKCSVQQVRKLLGKLSVWNKLMCFKPNLSLKFRKLILPIDLGFNTA